MDPGTQPSVLGALASCHGSGHTAGPEPPAPDPMVGIAGMGPIDASTLHSPSRKNPTSGVVAAPGLK